MSKTISITNDGDSPRYVMGRMIPPGETAVFAADEAPPEYRPEAETEQPAAQEDPLLAIAELSVAKLEAGLADLSDDELTRLAGIEQAKNKPRAGALAAITAERLRRAELAAPGGLPENGPVAVDGEEGA